MKLPKSENKDFELVPAGNHLAVCFQVIDLGTQTVEWQGVSKQQRKVRIGWELPGELMADGRPFMISNRYTFSTYERAKLRQHLESWRGKPFEDSDFGDDGFEVKNLIGCGCMLNVIHNKSGDRTYANIQSIAQMPKGQKVGELVNEPVYFSLEEPDAGIWDSLPDWLQEVIGRSPEYQALVKQEQPAPPSDDSQIHF